jgi:hypothetical protein
MLPSLSLMMLLSNQYRVIAVITFQYLIRLNINFTNNGMLDYKIYDTLGLLTFAMILSGKH